MLLALWDGWAAQGRGGTAEIVSYARRQHVPIVQVAVARLGSGSPHSRKVHEPELPEVFGLLSNQAFSRLDKFNSLRNRGTRSALLPPKLKTPVPSHVQSFVNYAQPYFDRAEEVARSSQLVFTWLTRLLYSLAAAAVIVVATQVIFFGHDHGIVWAEVVALVAVVVTLILGKRARWHDRWLGARYLAERIRSGVFLAAIGGGSDLRTAAGGVPPADCGSQTPTGLGLSASPRRSEDGPTTVSLRPGIVRHASAPACSLPAVTMIASRRRTWCSRRLPTGRTRTGSGLSVPSGRSTGAPEGPRPPSPSLTC